MSDRALVRTQRGVLHVCRQARAGWEPACYRPVMRGRDLVIHRGRLRAWRAWRLERVCRDCEHLLERGPVGFRQATGW